MMSRKEAYEIAGEAVGLCRIINSGRAGFIVPPVKAIAERILRDPDGMREVVREWYEIAQGRLTADALSRLV